MEYNNLTIEYQRLKLSKIMNHTEHLSKKDVIKKYNEYYRKQGL